jgi:hypothetical protein
MANKAKSSDAASVVFNLPDPDEPSKTNHAEVGGTATWNSKSLNYPEFEVSFKGANPFNNKKNAKFKGNQKQPIVLVLNIPGKFTYVVKHKKEKGNSKDSGPFCIGVAPPHKFFGRCKGCPPWGTNI